jgi:hypothetical protein
MEERKSLLAGLGSALLAGKTKLKQAATKDTSGPRITRETDIKENDVHSYQATVQDANIEVWESLVKQLTFRTEYLPMTVDEV